MGVILTTGSSRGAAWRAHHDVTVTTVTDRVAFVLHAAPDGQPTVTVT